MSVVCAFLCILLLFYLVHFWGNALVIPNKTELSLGDITWYEVD